MATRTRVNQDDEVVYNNERVQGERRTNWLPLLLIPLFLLMGLWALSPRTIDNSNTTNPGVQQSPGEQFGVGGAPGDTSPTVTRTPTPTEVTPSVSPMEDEVSPTETVTPPLGY